MTQHIDKRTKRREEKKTSSFDFPFFSVSPSDSNCSDVKMIFMIHDSSRNNDCGPRLDMVIISESHEKILLFGENEKKKKKKKNKTNCYSCTLNHCSIYTILMNLRLTRKHQQSYTCVVLAPSSTTFEETVFAGASDNVTI